MESKSGAAAAGGMLEDDELSSPELVDVKARDQTQRSRMSRLLYSGSKSKSEKVSKSDKDRTPTSPGK